MERGSPEKENQRWGTRVPLRHPVTIHWENHSLTGTVHTISVSGCFVEVAFPCPVGATLTLSFALDPEHPPVVTEGNVVMRNLGGVGVRFQYPNQDTALAVKRWIDAHGPTHQHIHRAA